MTCFKKVGISIFKADLFWNRLSIQETFFPKLTIQPNYKMTNNTKLV